MTQEEIKGGLREVHGKMLLSKKETAKELGISGGTLDSVRRKGGIKSKKILGQIFFDIGEVARFIAEA